MKQRILWTLALTVAVVSQAWSAQYVYPAKGQTPQQQKSDEAACDKWAVEQTGFDPTKPPLQQATFAKARAACLEGRGYTIK
jgi:hypothetical protein